MDTWIAKRLFDCLGFQVPDEMIQYILTLRDSHQIDEYFKTLLNLDLPAHKLFLNDFKQRLFNKSGGSGGSGSNDQKKGITKKNPLDGITNNNSNNKSSNKKQHDKYAKQKSPPAIDGIENKAPTTTPLSSSTAGNQPNSSSTSNATGAKKKTKYTNLYSQDGQLNDVILLKGRHHCNCQASKHRLVNNCLKCGRIVCEQEGSGPCLFCGSLVCSQDELALIESSSKKGDQLKKTLQQQQRPKGWEEAMAMRNKLLEYDRNSEKRTEVIDDESDYFKTNSVWLSDAERKRLKVIEDEMQSRKHASRLSRKVTIDFSGRQIIDEPQMTNADFEDEILQEIVNSASINANIMENMRRSDEKRQQQDKIDVDSVHPILEFEVPMFDNSVCTKKQVKTKNHRGGVGELSQTVSRVQDKGLLEISDLKCCMSMHQPWASLLVAGIKQHEGRTWYSSHRGRLWIASTAKPVDPEEIQQLEKFYKNHYNDNKIEFPTQYPSGCLLGCVLVQDCLPQEEYREQYPNGESESPFVFVCNEPQELPIRFPIKGQHKIYKLDQIVHSAAVKALQRMAKINAEVEKSNMAIR